MEKKMTQWMHDKWLISFHWVYVKVLNNIQYGGAFGNGRILLGYYASSYASGSLRQVTLVLLVECKSVESWLRKWAIYSWSSSRRAKVHTSQLYGILEFNRVASAPNRFATMLPASGARNQNFVCLAFPPWRQSALLNTCRNDDNSTEYRHGTETGRDKRRKGRKNPTGYFCDGNLSS